MARKLRSWLQVFWFVIILMAGVSFGHAAPRSSSDSILSLPERLAYDAAAVPVKVGEKVLPRTTTRVRNLTSGAVRTTGNLVRGGVGLGKRAVTTTVNAAEGAAKTVGNIVGTFGGSILRAARGR